MTNNEKIENKILSDSESGSAEDNLTKLNLALRKEDNWITQLFKNITFQVLARDNIIYKKNQIYKRRQ